MKQKIIKFIIFTVIVVVAVGCGKDSVQFSTKENQWGYPAQLRDLVQYEEGFYCVKDNYWLSYFDTQSKISTILCNKGGCEHDDEECFAYMNVPYPPFVMGNKLFFVDFDKILISNLDNTEKETYMTIAKEYREEERTIWVLPNYIMTGHTMYAVMQEEDYQSGDVKQMLWAIDLQTKKEEEIVSVDGDKKNIELLSAKDDVLYYKISNESALYEKHELTIEEQQEIEKTHYEEVYRADIQTGKKELIKKVENGVCPIANDEVGVYYGEFLGNGLWDLSSVFRIDLETKKEEKVIEHTEDFGINLFAMSSSEVTRLRVGTERYLYNMKTFTPIEFPEAILKESGMIYLVSEGYAYQIEQEESEYDWHYLPESEVGNWKGAAILAE